MIRPTSGYVRAVALLLALWFATCSAGASSLAECHYLLFKGNNPEKELPNSATVLSTTAAGIPLLSGTSGTGTPVFGAINLAGGSTIVTGNLPIGNGGSGLATTTANTTFANNTTGTAAPGWVLNTLLFQTIGTTPIKIGNTTTGIGENATGKIEADSGTAGQYGDFVGGSFNSPQLANVAAPTGITHGGTAASTSYTYAVVAYLADGTTSTAAVNTLQTTTGATTLTGTNTNIVAFTAVTGATSYGLYRTASSGTGNSALLGLVTTGASSPLTDTGTAPTSSFIPPGNSTGGMIWNVANNANDTGFDRPAAGQVEVNSGLATQKGTLLTGNVQFTQLTQPAAPGTITHGGTAGSTAYSYAITACLADGTESNVSTATATATGNATLTGTNTNIIPFTGVSNATSYNIYRTASSGTPSTTGLIGNVLASNSTGLTFTDTGIAASGTAPVVNKTGTVLTNAPVLLFNHTRAYLVSGSPEADGSTSGNSSLFIGPYYKAGGNLVTHWTGSQFIIIPVSEITFALTGLTASTNYDIYCNFLSQTVSLTAWSGNTQPTRGSDPAGRATKNGDTSSLLVGGFTAGSSTTTNDWTGNRSLSNTYNKIIKPVYCADTTPSWTWNTNAVREANGASSFGVSRIGYMTIAPSAIALTNCQSVSGTVASLGYGYVGIGVSGITPVAMNCTGVTNSSNTEMSCSYATNQAPGFQYYARLESVNTQACLFYGFSFLSQATSGSVQASSMSGIIWN